MKFFFILLIFPFYLYSQECQNLTWVKGPVTTEENEWFFFKGEGVDMDIDQAMIKARGLALDHLVNNCENIPNQTKILKSCKKRIGAGFQVFVQAAVFKADCFQIKLAKTEERENISNKELNEEYNSYNEKILKKLAPVEYECTPSVTKLCTEKGRYFFDLGVYPKALESLEYACESGDLNACFLGGFSSFMIKE
jgi:hypothetical protein